MLPDGFRVLHSEARQPQAPEGEMGEQLVRPVMQRGDQRRTRIGLADEGGGPDVIRIPARRFQMEELPQDAEMKEKTLFQQRIERGLGPMRQHRPKGVDEGIELVLDVRCRSSHLFVGHNRVSFFGSGAHHPAICKNMAMPHLSKLKHRERYVPPATLHRQLAEIKIVLDAIRLLPVATPLKRDMLDCALWKVAHATGNTQHRFMGRYRSETVTTQVGLKIQRDHAYSRATLIDELLGPSPNLDTIIDRAQCCCLVTEDEHQRLNRVEIDGWEKYRIVGIAIYDMLTETRLD